MVSMCIFVLWFDFFNVCVTLIGNYDVEGVCLFGLIWSVTFVIYSAFFDDFVWCFGVVCCVGAVLRFQLSNVFVVGGKVDRESFPFGSLRHSATGTTTEVPDTQLSKWNNLFTWVYPAGYFHDAEESRQWSSADFSMETHVHVKSPETILLYT